MRRQMPFNHNWRFIQGFKEEYLEVGVDESQFDLVHLPHTNQILPFNYFDEREYQGLSCYRKCFATPGDLTGKRVLLQFEGVSSMAEVYLNGQFVGEHKGGYTPFTVDLTSYLTPQKNLLVVKVDSRERPDIPPFGHVIDYLCYGGIYREVNLTVVDEVYIVNTFARPIQVLTTPAVLTKVYVVNTGSSRQSRVLGLELSQKGEAIARLEHEVLLSPGEENIDLELGDLPSVQLWDLDCPSLYDLQITLSENGEVLDRFTTRIGFREAMVKTDGFYLNGKRQVLRGLNRHQSYPYVGYAMPARVQRRDADILKYELGLQMVRTSHYPQSRHFLDRCDEIGLLVFEEIPGWQHIGDAQWKDLTCQHVREMIARDWNHPSIFLWGVRINESGDDHDLYRETNRIAGELDPTRQTGGVRYLTGSEFLEDVYTMNDFIHSGGEEVLRDQKSVTGLPHLVPYMVTEFNGHMYPTKRYDQEERLIEQAMRHLRVLSAAGADPHIAAAIGWCAFDYNTHFDFGSGDRICYHGVMDMFRIPKFAAMVYRSQMDPRQAVVLEPATHWARGDRSGGGVLPLVIFTNCQVVQLRIDDQLVGDFIPAMDLYPGVPHPPVIIADLPTTGVWGSSWSGAEFIGLIDGQAVARKTYVPNPVLTELQLCADDAKIQADGVDATRVVFRLVDQVGNPLPYGHEVLEIRVTGPGRILGPDQVVCLGGAVATWVQSTGEVGEIQVIGSTPRLPSQSVRILAGS